MRKNWGQNWDSALAELKVCILSPQLLRHPSLGRSGFDFTRASIHTHDPNPLSFFIICAIPKPLGKFVLAQTTA